MSKNLQPLFKKYQKKALAEDSGLRKNLKRNEDCQAGKGDLWRNKNQKAYEEGYDNINWKSKR